MISSTSVSWNVTESVAKCPTATVASYGSISLLDQGNAAATEILDIDIILKLVKFRSETPIFRDCLQAYQLGYKTPGKYMIDYTENEDPARAVSVYCDHSWMYILSRGTNVNVDLDDVLDFSNRTEEDYKLGFGKPEKEFWLGLNHIFE